MGKGSIIPDPNALKPNQLQYEAHALPADGHTGYVPKLPQGHQVATYTWYNVWARSPQAAVFLETDWQRLQMVAHLVDQLNDPDYEGPRATIMAEIRQNEAKLGATIADRSSLYMKLAAKTGTPAPHLEEGQEPLVPTAGRAERLRIVDDATG